MANSRESLIRTRGESHLRRQLHGEDGRAGHLPLHLLERRAHVVVVQRLRSQAADRFKCASVIFEMQRLLSTRRA